MKVSKMIANICRRALIFNIIISVGILFSFSSKIMQVLIDETLSIMQQSTIYILGFTIGAVVQLVFLIITVLGFVGYLLSEDEDMGEDVSEETKAKIERDFAVNILSKIESKAREAKCQDEIIENK